MLSTLLESHAKRTPEKEAVVFGDRRISYRALWQEVCAFGRGLKSIGVGGGVAVATLTESRPEFVSVFFAVARLGGVLVPLNTALKPSEIVFSLRASGARVLVTDPAHLALCEQVVAGLDPAPQLVVMGDGSEGSGRTYSSLLLAGPDDEQHPSHDGPFICLFSSGSTGKPKRLLRSQRNYVFECDGFAARTGTTDADRILASIPLYHSHGIGSCLLPSLCVGGTLVVLEPAASSDGDAAALFHQRIGRVLALIRQEQVTVYPSIPYALRALAEHPAAERDALSSVRHCFSSGNFLSREIFDAFHARFGMRIRQIYGSSEAGAISINDDPNDGVDAAGARPLPGLEVRIAGDDGAEMSPGTVGEITIRSAGLTAGYEDLPELTKQSWAGGYFHTGDLGYVDEGGRLVVTGRKKLIIDTGGKKVDPFEVEDVIAKHPHVAEVVVLGVPTASGTEIVKAVVVPRGACDKVELLAFCREHLADFKVPKLVELRDAIPKSATGKIMRKEMIAEGGVAEELRALLMDLIARGISSVREDDRAHTSFQSLGIDSTIIVELNAALEERFGALPKTLFFEYDNFADLVAYLREHHGERFDALVQELGAPPAPAAGHDAPRREGARHEGAIAIVGIAGRYPKAESMRALWNVLARGEDCIVEVPRDRWDHGIFYDARKGRPGKTYARWGGFLDGVDRFDAELFEVAPRDAVVMDPQERLFLETAWTALEDAGYSRSELSRRGAGHAAVGVFVGVMWGEYQLWGAEEIAKGNAMASPKSHYWSIANRVSYFFDFSGPSMAVDTACSSSLTAIHLACESIRSGECEMAIAGGVNLSLHPAKYLKLADEHFASSDGKCRSFGAGGDGYVPGEGVGAVVLKALDAALRDGDPIHAVIRGSALNHGGKTRSFTVPSPRAQADVVTKALDRSGGSAARVSYLEAHGTGTSLGDPIEMRALGLVFGDAVATGTCPIGSIKSNMGHLEAAAGIAGLTKVVLQMERGMLLPSLHAEPTNPNIDFAASPFFVQKTLAPWTRGVDAKGRALPRCAGVSSFGAGGANAHVVLEEAPSLVSREVRADDGAVQVLVLSARSAEQLAAYAGELRVALDDRSRSLAAVAWTLQIGREAMDERLAVVARTMESAQEALDAAVRGVEHPALVRGRAAASGAAITPSGSPADEAEALALGAAWVRGGRVDWRALHGGTPPRRVPLPTYPFARKSHWIARTTQHPLLDAGGASDGNLATRRYVKRFDAGAPWLRDHRIDGAVVVPAAVILEMARAAATTAMRRAPTALTGVMFGAPVVVGDAAGPVEVELQISASSFEIATRGEADQRHAHACGSFSVGELPPSGHLDWSALRARLTTRVDAGAFYARFEASGLVYGDGMRVVHEAACGDGEAIAHLVCTDPRCRDCAGDVVLCPALLDGALQAIQMLFPSSEEARLPFSIERLEVHRPLAGDAYVHVARAADEVRDRVDVTIADARGDVVARATGIALRARRREVADAVAMYVPTWAPAPVSAVATVAADDTGDGIVFRIGDGQSDVARAISDRSPPPSRVVYHLGRDATAEATFASLLALVKALVEGRARARVVCVGPDGSPLLPAVAGFARAVRLEQPGIRVVAVALDTAAAADTQRTAEIVRVELASHEVGLVRWSEGVRSVRAFARDVSGRTTGAVRLRDGGVYLVTGGAGGVARLLAEHIARQARVTLVLAGRSPVVLDDAWSARVRTLGARVVYARADVSDRAAVTSLVASVLAEHGRLDGVIHAAGVLRDSFLVHKTTAEADSVLAPKIAGALWLDDATRELSLDFFVLAASVTGVAGNVGQTDYAFANGFLDGFAHERAARVAHGARSGRTVAIDWPIWRDGGMRFDEPALARMRAAIGLVPLDTEAALASFDVALAGDAPQMVSAKGDLARFEEVLAASQPEPQMRVRAPGERSGLAVAMERFLCEQLAREAGIDAESINPEAPLERYGIRSIMVMNLNVVLERHFGEISKTLFYEYATVAALAEYFVREHGDALARMFGGADDRADALAAPAPKPSASPRPSKMGDGGDEPIAIIGLAGQFPRARNVAAFWENLVRGVDCVTEVPKDRWDAARYFDAVRSAGWKGGKWGGFLDDASAFDPLFFAISPREAEMMDPQERLFLQASWHAVEDAGYTRGALKDETVGVFVGVMYGDYALLALGEPRPRQGAPCAGVANRVSYFMGFNGPSMAIDTMCSSSLSALFLACEAIQRGHATMAIAGGVNLSLHPNKYLQLAQGGFLASDGRCRSFGLGGDGYVPGEGVGALVLKPLSRAIDDGDTIQGVIRAACVNHGGKTNGYTVPNPNAQSDLVRAALSRAGIAPRDIGYVEAHGTGTALGDPIEITALTKAFEQGDVAPQSCAIGSVKSNIGHLEATAGFAGLTKVLLQMKHATLVPSLHSDSLNPNVNFALTPFRVQRELSPWPRRDGRPRVAAVSSFGAGGANAHVILEEHVEGDAVSEPASAGPYIFLLSARDDARLRALVRRWVDALEGEGRDATWTAARVAFASQVAREAMESRLAVVCGDLDELARRLARWLDGTSLPTEVLHGRAARDLGPAGGLLQGAAGAEFVRLLLQAGDRTRLAQSWVTGVEVDWAALYAGARPRRVSLPLYPFAEERYWVDEDAPELVRVAWEPLAGASARAGDVVMVLASDVATGDVFRAALGDRAVVVLPGGALRRLGADTFEVRPDSRADFADVARELAARNRAPARIVHAWTWGGSRERTPLRDDAGAVRFGIVAAACALGGLRDAGGLSRLAAYGIVLGEHAPAAFEAMAALGRSLRALVPQLATRSVRIAQGGAAAVACVLDEIDAASDGDVELLFREGVRHERRLVPLAPGDGARPQLWERGHYVVSGGLGALGLLFCEQLARRHRARLTILGRSALDDARRARLEALGALGGDTRYVALDVGDTEAVHAAIARARADFGPVRGVFHCAGVAGGLTLLDKDAGAIAAALHSTIHGAHALDDATSGDPLDLFVLCSSTSAELGDFGQGDDAAGSRFLDAFAREREEEHRAGRRPGATFSIGWPLWREGRTQATLEADRPHLEASGTRYLETAPGLRAFERVLASGEAHVLVRAPRAHHHAPVASLVAPPPPLAQSAVIATAAAAEPPGTPRQLEAELIEFASTILSLPVSRIDPEESLGNYGFDSVKLTELAQAISERFGVEVLPTIFYAHGSLRDVAERFGARLAAAPAPAAPTAAPRVAPPAAPQVAATEPIAIIGVAGVLPGAPDLETFWENLVSEGCAVTETPASRWDWREHLGAEGRPVTKWGAFIDDADKFDARFFRISPREADEMDPQHRIFLEACWKAIEDAGYAPPTLAGRSIGVYAGAEFKDYEALQTASAHGTSETSTGNSHSMLANRVSYLLDFHGASECIDTACSSSLVALHRAIRSLRSGECEMALAGGVSLMLDPWTTIGTSKLGVLAPDGRCKTFDAEANGYVRGEGVGVILLKPLSQALRDRDHVHAVLRGSAVNHGGRAASLTAPNASAQAQLLARAYEEAAIEPETVSYLEAHGTGTSLGDPIEMEGAAAAFALAASHRGRALAARGFCGVGSVKTNIGHLEPAAGIAGLLKVVLAMKHRTLPGNPMLRRMNPLIRVDDGPLYLVDRTRPWDVPQGVPRRAGVSSFGYGGTNAHVLLEEPPAQRDNAPAYGADAPWVVTLSAANEEALRELTARWARFVARERKHFADAASFARLVYTAQVGRTPMRHRMAIVAFSVEDLEAKLRAADDVGIYRGVASPARGGDVASPVEESDAELAAERWARGEAIDWAGLWRACGGEPGRTPVPTYPFARVRHWFEDQPPRRREPQPQVVQEPPPQATIAQPAALRVAIADRLRADLVGFVHTITKVPASEIDLDQEVREFGLESVQMTELCVHLVADLGLDVTPSIFFEISPPTLSGLASHLLARQAAALEAAYSAGEAPPVEAPRAQVAPSPAPTTPDAGAARKHEPIAIVGMAGILPGSPDLGAFWANIAAGKNLVSEIPEDRWDWRAYHGDPTKEANKTHVHWGGFVADVDKFDAMFFGISAKEAELMDPQQRLILMTVWRAVEDAGYRASELAKVRTGLFIGAATNDYQELQADCNVDVEAYTVPGVSHAVLANRISYQLGLTGPSEPVDTACSSSIVAVHRGVELLRSGACDVVIAGAVNVILSPRVYISLSKAGMLSADGRCKTFDKSADGYVRGEGAAAVVMKPLSSALADGDHVYAVIRGSAVNHGGRATSLTAPNGNAQTELLVQAHEIAGVDPATVTYIEAHGTGTALGDPVEVSALKRAFAELHARRGRSSPPTGYCGLGSVKTNIGHLEPAAGMAGLLKVVLAMGEGTIPAHLHFQEMNPYIELEGSPFYVVAQSRAWTRLQDDAGNTLPRRAGLSSFGFGGSNSHVVLEEYLPQASAPEAAPLCAQLVPLSAKTEEALRTYARDVAAFLATARTRTRSASDAAALEKARVCVTEMAARVQGVSPSEFDPREDLREHGFDVVRLYRLLSEASGALGVDVSLDDLGDEVTIERIAGLVAPAPGGGGVALADVAFTLQEGREPLEERLCVLCNNVDELEAALVAFAAGDAREHAIARGRVRRRKGPSSDRANEQELARRLAGEGRLREVSELWVQGADVAWSLARGSKNGRRLSLPTYPFAKDRHWIESKESAPRAPAPSVHPMIARDMSRDGEACFEVDLSGDEFFLRDHVASGKRVLPGVAYLEMARAAADRAPGKARVTRLRGVVWAKPIVATGRPLRVSVRLNPGAREGDTSYEVRSVDEAGADVTHAQGTLAVGALGEPPAALDVAAIRARAETTLESDACYALFADKGMAYGATMRGVRTLYTSSHEALVRIVTPVSGAEDQALVLHPATMDAAMQAVISIDGARAGTTLPFAIEEVEIHAPPPREGWAWARLVREERALRTYDVVLADDSGRACVVLRRLVVRLVAQTEERPSELAYAVGEWRVEAAAPVRAEEARVLLVASGGARVDAWRTALRTVGVREDRVAVAASGALADYRALFAAQRDAGALPTAVIHLAKDAAPLDAMGSADFDGAIHAVVPLAQALSETRPRAIVPIAHVYHVDASRPGIEHAAVAGFARTLRMENPRLIVRSVALDAADAGSLAAAARSLLDGAAAPGHLRVRGGVVERLAYRLMEGAASPASLREGGTYLITGGIGGLGLIFAKYLARDLRARLVLAGRSEPSPERRAEIDALRALGAEVHFVRADVSRAEDVERLVAEAKRRFGSVHGVLHSAGITRDALLPNKTREQIDAVLQAKVLGALNLDRVLKNEPLDFFALFSSAAALVGSPGQTDYAYANQFLGELAAVREQLRARGERSGKSIALAWQLWADGGMTVDDETRAWIWREGGMRPLETATGVAAFRGALGMEASMVGVLYGDRARLAHPLTYQAPRDASPPETRAVAPAAAKGATVSLAALEGWLKELLAKASKTPVSKIRSEDPLENYGLDSVMIMTLTRELEATFGELSKTLFFEMQTLRELAEYFAAEHVDAVRAIVGTPEAAPDATLDIAPAPLPAPAPVVTLVRSAPAPFEGREDIAVIGMAGRYPEADNLHELWENLVSGRDCIVEVPEERWDHGRYFSPVKGAKGKAYSKWGGFMRDFDKFDPLYFNISPAEARFMDPQERLFLEIASATLQDAGYTKAALRASRVGVFVGLMFSHYQLYAAEESMKGNVMSLGFSYSSIANRVSYHFDLRGPSVALDTMCSSSFTALDLACRAIWDGTCDAAIAGGVNLSVHPNKYIMLSEGRFSSTDGRCRSFGEGGDGYVPGEGVGAVMVKPLRAAIADGDHIELVIKAIAVNHGGKTNGFSVPNPHAQSELVEKVWREAHIDPRDLGYIEAHGTGTSLGDPIEITALTKAFRKWGEGRGVCPIGSVKSNVGHLEATAGMVALNKVALQMKHGKRVPSLHSEQLNPNIRFDESPFVVQQACEDWPRRATAGDEGAMQPRLAAISSFGAGGSNAHVVVAEYIEPARVGSGAAPGPHVFVLSARSPERLAAYATALAVFARREASVDAADVAFTLQIGRDELDHRLAVVARDLVDLAGKLEDFAAQRSTASAFTGNARRDRDAAAQLLDGDEAAELVAKWAARGKLEKIAAAWVQGADIDWRALPQSAGRRRVSVPAYPFERERYWFKPARAADVRLHVPLHPLVDDIDERRTLEGDLVFRKVLRASDWVVRDHRVAGRLLLPGVASLEIAFALGARHFDGPFEVRRLVWTSPVAVADDGEHAIAVRLRREGDGLALEITGADGAVHSRAALQAVRGDHSRPSDTRVSIEALRSRMPERIASDEFYRGYEAIDIVYGPNFRGVREAWAGENEVLGRLRITDAQRMHANEMTLHPTLADGALQLIAGLARRRGPGATTVPFSIGQARCFAPLGEEAYAHVVATKDDAYRVTILDASGAVAALIDDVVVRPLRDASTKSANGKTNGTNGKTNGHVLDVDAMLQFFHRPVWTPSA